MDRNVPGQNLISGIGLSLSARRAWIEIILDYFSAVMRQVALRKESVDRNHFGLFFCGHASKSLSARRAWIEMFLSMGLDGRFKRRSPQGERG